MASPTWVAERLADLGGGRWKHKPTSWYDARKTERQILKMFKICAAGVAFLLVIFACIACSGPQSQTADKPKSKISLKTQILTPHVSAARDFYIAVFRMKIVEQWSEADDVGVILSLPSGRGEAFLELKKAQGPNPTGMSLQFRVDDINEFVETIPNGFKYEGPEPRPWGSTYLYMKDPAGVDIIVYSGGN